MVGKEKTLLETIYDYVLTLFCGLVIDVDASNQIRQSIALTLKGKDLDGNSILLGFDDKLMISVTHNLRKSFPDSKTILDPIKKISIIKENIKEPPSPNKVPIKPELVRTNSYVDNNFNPQKSVTGPSNNESPFTFGNS
jgi:hypothetical protein